MFRIISCIAILWSFLIVPASGQVQRTEAELEYFKQVTLLLAKARRFPPAAKAKRLEGRVIVRFSVASDGRITSRHVIESSGHEILDREALSMVDRVNPLPPLPPDAKNLSRNFTVPIRFRIPQELSD